MWGKLEQLQDGMDDVKKKIDRANKRGNSTVELEQDLEAATEALRKQLRSAAQRRTVAQARLAMQKLPELVLKLRALDPYYNSEARGLPQRNFASYSGRGLLVLIGFAVFG